MSVTILNRKIELFFIQNSEFREVHVKGEVSGLKISQSGHIYFNLKDKRSYVPCIIYRGNRRNIDFEIKEGMKLFVIANVGVYRPHGKYQLEIFDVAEDGLGKLYIKFQQLKEKLSNEGLFNNDLKKPLPNFAKRIGVITSKEGSVIHDMIRTINQKWPYCELLLFPSQVQGSFATKQLIKQIKLADSYNLDLLIVARGGGSIEDLWCFNEESLVRCIFECNTPVISGIGHEDDITLCDLVSDVSASTPTMAANFAINDKNNISNQVNNCKYRLMDFISSKIQDYKKQYKYMLSKQLFKDSNFIYNSKVNDFNNLCGRFEYNSKMLITSKKNMLNEITSSYVIRHPCKIQVDSSRTKLNDLQKRLINAINLTIKSNKINLDKASDEFKFSSNNYLSSQKNRLNSIKNSYSIQNPCKIKLDKYYSDLNVLQDKLIKSINYKLDTSTKDYENLLNRNLFKNPTLIYDNKSKNLNELSTQFLNKSNEIILTNSYRLDSIKNNNFIKNPNVIFKTKFDDLNVLEDKLIKSIRYKVDLSQKDYVNLLNRNLFKNPCLIYESKYQDFKVLTNKFLNKSNELILTNSYRLNSIKNENVIKNPNIILKTKSDNLEKIKGKQIIKNPYMILNNYNQRLNVSKQKLDKINNVLILKKEQEKQKTTYRIIIIAMVIIVIIIIFILINGGI